MVLVRKLMSADPVEKKGEGIPPWVVAILLIIAAVLVVRAIMGAGS
jgi:hypothetical protein